MRQRRSLILEQLESRLTPSTLIPVADRRDLVFDATRDLLYITTSSGLLQRYDVAHETLLAPWSVGTSLNGADITRDGSALYVAENQLSGSQGVLHRVDLNDGRVTDITYTPVSGEGGTWDIAVANNGTALLSTYYWGYGGVPFRQLDLNTGILTIRTDTPGSWFGGEVRGDVHIDRSADGSLLFMAEPDISTGQIFTYDSASDTFPHQSRTDCFYYNRLQAVNRDGSLIASELGYGAYYFGVSVMDSSFHSLRTFGTNFDGGLAFDPSRDLLYLADAHAGRIVAYDTHTWAERFRLDIGETIPAVMPFDNGEMTVRSDGSELFLSTRFGVRMIDLPPSTGVASRLDVTGFPSFITAGTIGRFTVSARDPAGSIDTGFIGTVHFSSSDPAALLQQPYTFTPDDHGVHTFDAVLQTAGTFSITATDDADGLSGSQTNIQVHTDPVSLIPVVNHRDLVFDPNRGILYITTSDGLVQRYDVNSQTLLAPWIAGASVYGADITPDGAYLYTTEAVRGATQGMLHKINLDDASETNLPFDRAFLEGGTWAVTIANNGKALFDSLFEGSGWLPLRQIDLSTDGLSVRTDPPGSGGGGQIRQSTHIRRSADRSLLFLMESTISSGPIFDYRSSSDSFSPSLNLGVDLTQSLGAVSRDGSQLAMEIGSNVFIRDADLNLLTTLPNLGGGLTFDPIRDLLYAATTTQIIAYDTNTWTETYRFDIGQTVPFGRPFNDGEMAVSDDGSLLFFATPTGVRVYPLGGSAAPHAAWSVALAYLGGSGSLPVGVDQWGMGGAAHSEQANAMSIIIPPFPAPSYSSAGVRDESSQSVGVVRCDSSAELPDLLSEGLLQDQLA
jgi:sugar lactone lactonase YvrE